MKKNLLTIILILQSCLLLGQVTEKIKILNLIKIDCVKDTTKLPAGQPSKQLQVADETANYRLGIVFEKKGQSKDADKTIQLKNFNNDKLIKGALNVDTLFFDLGKPLEAVSNSLYQIVAIGEKGTCYDVIRFIKAKGGKEKPNNTTVPELQITPFITSTDPCLSCEVTGKKITYDFGSNQLKYTPTGSWFNRNFGFKAKAGEPFTFEIINVNPFKYDVTLTDEPVVINTDVPDALNAAFTMKGGIGAIGAEKDKSTVAADWEKALIGLDKALDEKLKQLQNAGDCFNPCEQVGVTMKEINEYFHKHFGYADSKGPLETFLIDAVNANFDAKADADKITKFKAIISKLYTFRYSAVSRFSYRMPQLKSVDQYVFKLNITPKANVSAGARVLNQEIAVDVLGGWKVDVTSGLFFTGLADHKFTLQPDSLVLPKKSGYGDSIVYNSHNKVIQESNQSRDFGVSSLFHFYPKLTSSVNIAFSLGAGVTLNSSPKLRYLAGGSLLIGKTGRLALTYGVAFGYVDRLSDRYNDVKDQATGSIIIPRTEKTVVLKKQFDHKGFFGLTYSLPVFKKKEEVKVQPAADQTAKQMSSSSDSTGADTSKKTSETKKS